MLSFGFAGASAAGETAFEENCAKCHPRPAFVARNVPGNSEQERRHVLDQILSTHHAEAPALRAEIIDYLIGLPGQ
ncbi:MAG: hypothetical protein AB7G54_02610 [Methyloceanibacter sp.]